MWAGNISYGKERSRVKNTAGTVTGFFLLVKALFSLFRLAFSFIDGRMQVWRELVRLDPRTEVVGRWRVLNTALAAKKCCGAAY